MAYLSEWNGRIELNVCVIDEMMVILQLGRIIMIDLTFS